MTGRERGGNNGDKAKGFTGITIKDTWTITRWGGNRGGRWEGWGGGEGWWGKAENYT